MRFLGKLVAAIVVVACVLAPAARADPDDALARARTHFWAGEKHYNLGEFADALREFKDSYRLKNDPVLLYNIGQCQLKLGDDRAALHSFRGYLRLAANPSNRKMAEEKIAQIEQRLNAGPAMTTAAAAEAGERRPAPVFTEGRPPVAVAGGSSTAGTVPGLADPFASGKREPAAEIEARRSLLSRWWVWAIAASVVAGAVTTAVIANRGGGGGPDCLGVSPCGTLR
jgi:tetratricopeptide (TPR) repeat protein